MVVISWRPLGVTQVTLPLIFALAGVCVAQLGNVVPQQHGKLRGTISITDLEGKYVKVFSAPRPSIDIKVMAWPPAVSGDGRFVTWNLPAILDVSKGSSLLLTDSSEPIKELEGLVQLALSGDGRSLLVASIDGRVMHWDVINKRYLGDFLRSKSRVVHFRFSKNGRWLAIREGSGDVLVYDWSNQRVVQQLKDIGGILSSIDISNDGRYVATACFGNKPVVWNARTGATLFCEAPDNFMLYCWVALTTGGQMFALGSLGHTGIIVVETASKGVRFRGRVGNQVQHIVFTPDGRMVVGTCEGAVSIWDLAEDKEALRLVGSKSLFAEVVPATGDLLIVNREKVYLLPHHFYLRKWGDEPKSHIETGVLEKAWNDLADGDSVRAFRAMRTFLSCPEQAVRYLEKVLAPVLPLTADEMRQALCSIEQLAAIEPEARREAVEQLRRLGWRAFPLVKRAREEHKEAEVRRQCALLLRDLEHEGTCNLRERRALEILEYLRSDATIALIRKLASGISEAPLTLAAKESLERLSPPPSPGLPP